MEIGIIGTDSSHAIAFSKRLQDKGHQIFAYQGGSNIAISQTRIEAITEQLKCEGIEFFESIEALASHCDAFMITSVDASQHKAQFEILSPYKRPIFIDKPFTMTYKQALEIEEQAQKLQVPVMSSSALRFTDEVQQAKKSIVAVDVYAPLPMLEKYDYFYYGIHALEILCTLIGTNIYKVAVECDAQQHFITLTLENGLISTIRGQEQNRQSFQFVTHTNAKSEFYSIAENDFHFYDRLVDAMEQFFVNKQSIIELKETVQIIHVLEKIQQSARMKTVQFIDF